MSDTPKILPIEDDVAIAGSLRRVLVRNGYDIEIITRGDEGLERAQRERFDVVLTDFKLPGLDGLELVKRLHAVRPLLPVIVMTAHGTTETAIEATKLGAYDYVLKPFEVEELLDLINKATTSRLASEPVEMGAPISARDAIIGNSRVMQTVYKEIGRIAAKPVTVLVRGETGTGKELIARALSTQQSRRQAVHCRQLRCDSGNAARKRTVRPRTRRIHRSQRT